MGELADWVLAGSNHDRRCSCAECLPQACHECPTGEGASAPRDSEFPSGAGKLEGNQNLPNSTKASLTQANSVEPEQNLTDYHIFPPAHQTSQRKSNREVTTMCACVNHKALSAPSNAPPICLVPRVREAYGPAGTKERAVMLTAGCCPQARVMASLASLQFRRCRMSQVSSCLERDRPATSLE